MLLTIFIYVFFFFFFNDTATTEIYTLSLHDALPIFRSFRNLRSRCVTMAGRDAQPRLQKIVDQRRRHAFRSQRCNAATTASKAFHGGKIARVRRADLGFEMNALARLVERGAFEVKAEHAWNLQR